MQVSARTNKLIHPHLPVFNCTSFNGSKISCHFVQGRILSWRTYYICTQQSILEHGSISISLDIFPIGFPITRITLLILSRTFMNPLFFPPKRRTSYRQWTRLGYCYITTHIYVQMDLACTLMQYISLLLYLRILYR